MYFPGLTLMGPSKKLTEEELMQPVDIKGLALRLGIAFAAFALLILSLSVAYDDKRPQTVATDHSWGTSGAERRGPY